MLSMEWLFSWQVVSASIGVFVTIGLGVLALDDFKAAKVFFPLSAVDAVSGIVMAGSKSTLTTWVTNLVVICAAGAVGLRIRGRGNCHPSKLNRGTDCRPSAETQAWLA